MAFDPLSSPTPVPAATFHGNSPTSSLSQTSTPTGSLPKSKSSRTNSVITDSSMGTTTTTTDSTSMGPTATTPSSKSHPQVIIISTSVPSCVLVIACAMYCFLKWKKKRRKLSTGKESSTQRQGEVEAVVEPFLALSSLRTSIGPQTANPPLPNQAWRPTSIRALGKLARFGKKSASPVPSAPLSTVDNSSTTANLEQQMRSLHDMMQQVSATVARMETSNTRMNAHGDTPSEDPPPDYADSRSEI